MTETDFKERLAQLIAIAADAAAKERVEHRKLLRAKDAYQAALPELTNRRATQLYIAGVAQGMQSGFIDPDDAKRYLYVAQLALSAFGNHAEGPATPHTTARPGWTGNRRTA